MVIAAAAGPVPHPCLAVNPIIYSELSLAFHAVEEQDRALQSMDLKYQELPRPALFLAGLAFVPATSCR